MVSSPLSGVWGQDHIEFLGDWQGKEPTVAEPGPGGILHVEVLILKGGGVGTCGRETWEWCRGVSLRGCHLRVPRLWASIILAFSLVKKKS